MKKKWLSVVALCMCFSMGISAFAGCGGDSTDGNGGGTKNSEQGGGNGSEQGGNGGEQGGNGGETSLTQDQILNKIIEASEATMAYKGAYTMTMLGVDKETTTTAEGEEKYDSTMSGIISVDAAAGKLFMVNTEKDVEDGITETEEMTVKYFTEGDKSYSYMKQKQTSTEEGQAPIEQDMYAEVSAYALKAAMAEYGFQSSGYFNIASAGLNEGMNVDAYNEAYATIIADSKAAIALEANNEESKWYQSTVDASVLISCSVTNGVYSVSTKVTMSMITPESSESGVQETIITAKDGKLLSIEMKEQETETTYRVYTGEGDKEWYEVPAGTEGAIQVTEKEDYSYAITMSYEFAEASYNAITTTLPDASQIMPAGNYFSTYVDMIVNGVEWSRTSLSGETAEEAISDIEEPYGMDVVWYKDAACTQPIDETITIDEILAMDTIYGKATAEEGYALYTTESVTAFGADVPEAYKLVFGSMMSAGYKNIGAAMVGEGEYEGIYLYQDSDNEVVTVNGTAVEFEEGESTKYYQVTEGQTYTVKKTRTYMKADLNFFEMMF